MDEEEEERPLHHVEHHAAEGDLQRAEVRVDGEDVDELQVGEDVGGGEEALGDQHRVPRVPLVPGAKLWLSRVIYFYDFTEPQIQGDHGGLRPGLR